jgi:hypothetical protein
MPLCSGGLRALVLAATVAGCATSVGYAPKASMSQPEAMTAITRSLEEQPSGFPAMDVDVSAERLTFSLDGTDTRAAAAHEGAVEGLLARTKRGAASELIGVSGAGHGRMVSHERA